MHKISLLFSFFLFSIAHTQGFEDLVPLSSTTSEEALFVRRIVEFWKDEDDALVKVQINQFFTLYPKSEFSDGLYAILGDIHWKGKLFESALDAYDHIQGAAHQQKVLSKRLDCLHHLQRYAHLVEYVRPYLPQNGKITPEQQLWVVYYAEALVQLAKQSSDSAQAQQYYRLARTHYKSLLTSNHADAAKLALAEIYQALKLPQEAIDLYEELAKKQPENREDYLFAAARIQSAMDPQAGMAAFSRLQQMKGKKAGDAAVSRLALLFDQGKYLELIDEAEFCRDLLSSQQQYARSFLLGKSYAALDQHEQAVYYLHPLLTHHFTEPATFLLQAQPSEKAILLLLIASGYHLNELVLVDEWSHRYEAAFPQDPAIGHVWYLNALTYKNCDHFLQAQLLLEKIMQECPNFEKIEVVQLERASLLCQQKKWEESRQASVAFLAQHPSSENRHIAIQTILKTSLQRLSQAEASQEPVESLCQQLKEDLQHALASPEEQEQRPAYLILLAKMQYKLKQYAEALKVLDDYFLHYPQHEQCYQAHLLAARCHQQGTQDLNKYIAHQESALALKSDGSESISVHVNLFHAYLQMPQSKSAKNAKEKLDKAIKHLEAAYAVKPDIIQTLHQHYGAHSEASKELYPLALFSFATLWQQTGSIKAAQQLYAEISLMKGIDRYVAAATQLNAARLTFVAMTPEQRSLENPTLLRLLQTLKDLQIRKVLTEEPVHLEAAWEYAMIRSSLAPAEKQKEQLLFHLLRAKEEFTTAQDLCSRDYYASCQLYPEQARLYEAYLLLFDAHIARLRGEIAHQEGRVEERDACLEAAKALSVQLLQEHIISTNLIETITKRCI